MARKPLIINVVQIETAEVGLSGIGTGSVAKIMHNSASFTLDLVMAECDGAGRLDSFRGE